MAVTAYRRAMKEGADEVRELIVESGLYAEKKRFRRTAGESAREKGYEFLSEEFLPDSISSASARKVTYKCPVGHEFTMAPRLFEKLDVPCPLCASRDALDRLQVNIRLSPKNTQRYYEMSEFYGKKDTFTYLGVTTPGSAFTGGTTVFARFILEAALDDIYLDYLNEVQLEELASWIDIGKDEKCAKALAALDSEAGLENQFFSDEFKYLVHCVDKLKGEYYRVALNKWGNEMTSALFEEFWGTAVIRACKNAAKGISSNVSPEALELKRRVKRLREKYDF